MDITAVSLQDVTIQYCLRGGRRTAWHPVQCYQVDVGAVLWQSRLMLRVCSCFSSVVSEKATLCRLHAAFSETRDVLRFAVFQSACVWRS